MSMSSRHQNVNDSSDYGSEFDVNEAAELLDAFQAADLLITDGPVAKGVNLLYNATSSNARSLVGTYAPTSKQPPDISLPEVAIHTRSSYEGKSATEESPGKLEFAQTDLNIVPDDTRPPLERFRTAPKKPLSVTDIVSPAWCELQYLKSLQRYGRVKRTAAMKRGSEVHKSLEEEVHRTVSVEVQTREDHWAVKLWNAIHGLRTLRTTGLTRELEVWGVFEGQVVNGIIDELSYTCTDQDLEASSSPLPDVSDTVTCSRATEAPVPASVLRSNRKVFISDVKTRAYSSLPKSSSMRPARLQLMLYRKILSALATRCVEPGPIFDRYNLDPFKSFSDSLLSQLWELETNVRQALGEPSVDVAWEIAQHNSLAQLWALLLTEYGLTMPHGSKSVSDVLNIEFRYRETGDVLGCRTFLYDEDDISCYLADELRWWRGERETKGVEVEEAFKCSRCEFAETCAWRLERVKNTSRRSK